MGFGALNEVIEFIAFITLSKTGVGDVYNTGFDLVFNLLGALAGAFFANYLSKR
jgi:glycopeptide antibiotics resistance protein